MNSMVGVISYGLGTLAALAFVAWLVIAIVHDVTQKKRYCSGRTNLSRDRQSDLEIPR